MLAPVFGPKKYAAWVLVIIKHPIIEKTILNMQAKNYF